MTSVPIIGLTGKVGSGKDTVYNRLVELFGKAHYQRASFADPLKRSVAGLLGITVNQIEMMKNEPKVRVSLLDLSGGGRDLGRSFSMREFLQRYGTEAHRDIPEMGEDFWVKLGIDRVNYLRTERDEHGNAPTFVFTDVRFINEAEAIIKSGGKIYRVEGPELIVDNVPSALGVTPANDHPSEMGVPEEMISGTVINFERPKFEILSQGGIPAQDEIERCIAIIDDEVAKLHAELTA